MHVKTPIRPFGALVLILFSIRLQAQVVVSPEPVIITQADGSTLTIIGVGIIDNSFTETIDGYTLLRNKKGIYVYAKSGKNQQLIPSKLKAHDSGSRTRKEIRCLSKNFKPHAR